MRTIRNLPPKTLLRKPHVWNESNTKQHIYKQKQTMTGLQKLVRDFQYYQNNPCVIRHRHNAHQAHLTAVATATELGLMMIQRYPAPMIADLLRVVPSSMERQMHHHHHHHHPFSSRVCPTCQECVPVADYDNHVQIHAAAAFMATIFEPYDPERPGIDR